MSVYVLDVLRQGGKITVIAPKSLGDDDLCVFGAGYGAPSVSNERVSSGTDVFDAIDAVNKVMGYKDFAALVADEIGGGNGIVTFPSSAHYSKPVVDCDLMVGLIPRSSMERHTCTAFPYVRVRQLIAKAMSRW